MRRRAAPSPAVMGVRVTAPAPRSEYRRTRAKPWARGGWAATGPGRYIACATAPGRGDKERTIIQLAREAVSEPKVSQATFQKAQAVFGNKGVMDLAGLIGYYSFVNITLKTFDVQLAPGRTRLLPPLW